MAQETVIQGEIKDIVRGEDVGKNYYKRFTVVGFEGTLFAWKSDVEGIDSVKISDTAKITHDNAKFPKILKVEKVTKDSQTTVNGKVEHTDRPVGFSNGKQAMDTSTAERVARSVAVKAAVELIPDSITDVEDRCTLCTNIAFGLTHFILTGKQPELNKKSEPDE